MGASCGCCVHNPHEAAAAAVHRHIENLMLEYGSPCDQTWTRMQLNLRSIVDLIHSFPEAPYDFEYVLKTITKMTGHMATVHVAFRILVVEVLVVLCMCENVWLVPAQAQYETAVFHVLTRFARQNAYVHGRVAYRHATLKLMDVATCHWPCAAVAHMHYVHDVLNGRPCAGCSEVKLAMKIQDRMHQTALLGYVSLVQYGDTS